MMQISVQETGKVSHATPRKREHVEPPARTVEELAAKNGVDMDEVRRVAALVKGLEDDPARERRVNAIAAKIEAGEYEITAEEVIDMAERRAVADRAAEL